MIENHETFTNAPIEEAVIDLLVDHRPSLTLDGLSGVLEALSAKYPLVQPRVQVKAKFGVKSTGELIEESSTEPAGWALRSTDPPGWIVLVRIDGVSISRLRPYTRWDELEARARSVWSAYANVAKPVAVRRVATRFINRLVIPEASFRWSDWLRTGVQLGPGIPDSIGEVSFRTVISDGRGSAATVALVTEPRSQGGGQPILLDIDASRAQRLATGSEDIWEALSALRDLKNTIFFGSVTERTKELFR